MKCPICNEEYSEPILPFHIERCKKGEKAKDAPQEKSIDKMNKDELVAKAKELEIVIEDVEKTTKTQIIEMIKAKDAPQE